MDLNFLVFRPPQPSYKISTLGSSLLWVPRDFSSCTIEQQFLFELQLQNRKSLTPAARNISTSCCPFRNKEFQNSCIRISTNGTINSQKAQKCEEDIVDSEGEEFGGCLSKNIKKYQTDLGYIRKKLEFQKTQVSKKNGKQQGQTNLSEQNGERGRKRETQENNYIKYIPCLNLTAPESKYIILFFHSNGEDIEKATSLLTFVRDQLQIRIVALEYSGYGIYKSPISPNKMKSDALQVYDYLMALNEETEIILFGRSIGTGLACHVARQRKPKAIVLMSAFTSVKDIARDWLGQLSSYAIKEKFNNLENIKYITCPTLFIHGLNDKTINFKHTQELTGISDFIKNILIAQCQAPFETVYPAKMDHSCFNFFLDLTYPMKNFLIKCGIDFNLIQNKHSEYCVFNHAQNV